MSPAAAAIRGSFATSWGDPGRYDIRNRFIEDCEVAQLFLDADVVALPYVEASQSGVLNIAAAFGCPVVATDVGEFRATVERRRLGVVAPPGDPARLAEAIALLGPRSRRSSGARPFQQQSSAASRSMKGGRQSGVKLARSASVAKRLDL